MEELPKKSILNQENLVINDKGELSVKDYLFPIEIKQKIEQGASDKEVEEETIRYIENIWMKHF